jgi:hypothetical protein
MLSSSRRKLAKRRDEADHLMINKLRAIIAQVDASLLIAKEIQRDEHERKRTGSS